MKRKLAVLLAAGSVATGLVGCASGDSESGDASSDGVVKVRMAIVDNENSNYYKGAQKIAEEVDAATDGKVKIDVFAGGSLGDERGTVEMAMNGDLEIAVAANPVFTNWIPQMGILDQAFLWDTTDEAHAAVDGKLGELIGTELEAQGLHLLGFMESGFRNVFSKDPIDKMDDFSGVKIRTMQNQYHMAAFEAFGAMPTAMAAGEQFTALQQGTIDAAENATSNMLVNKFYEVITHHTETEHAFVYMLVVMSDKSWQQIPEDMRPAVVEAVKKGCDAQREYLEEANAAAVDELKENGVEFHEIDRDGLKAAYEAVAESNDWSFDSKWQEAVDAVRSGS